MLFYLLLRNIYYLIYIKNLSQFLCSDFVDNYEIIVFEISIFVNKSRTIHVEMAKIGWLKKRS